MDFRFYPEHPEYEMAKTPKIIELEEEERSLEELDKSQKEAYEEIMAEEKREDEREKDLLKQEEDLIKEERSMSLSPVSESDNPEAQLMQYETTPEMLNAELSPVTEETDISLAAYSQKVEDIKATETNASGAVDDKPKKLDQVPTKELHSIMKHHSPLADEHVHFGTATEPHYHDKPTAWEPANAHVKPPWAQDVTIEFRGQPWAYESLARWQKTDMVAEEIAHDGIGEKDTTLDFHAWAAGSHALVKAMEKVDKSSARLFRKHFDNVTSMYNEQLWSALRLYDIRIRYLHLGDSSNDLANFDRRLFGKILQEDPDEYLADLRGLPRLKELAQPIEKRPEELANGFQTGVPEPDEDLSFLKSLAEDMPTSPDMESMLRSDDSVMVSFLESVYAGLGRFASSFQAAGVTSPEMLAELTLLQDSSLTDLLGTIEGLSTFLKLILVSTLKRRFLHE